MIENHEEAVRRRYAWAELVGAILPCCVETDLGEGQWLRIEGTLCEFGATHIFFCVEGAPKQPRFPPLVEKLSRSGHRIPVRASARWGEREVIVVEGARLGERELRLAFGRIYRTAGYPRKTVAEVTVPIDPERGFRHCREFESLPPVAYGNVAGRGTAWADAAEMAGRKGRGILGAGPDNHAIFL